MYRIGRYSPLALVMARSFFVLCCAFWLMACSNESAEVNTVLKQGAYASLTDSIQQYPRNADLYYRRGVQLYSGNEKALAETDLRTAWQLAPKETFALSLATLLKEKSADSAIVFLQAAQKTLPESVGISIALARGYQQKGEPEKALTLCQQILARYPNSLDALTLQSELLAIQKKDTESLTALEKAYSLAPNDIELVNNLAFAYAENGNPNAIKLSDSLLKKDTEGRHAEPYYFKALYFENTGNATEALRLLEEAVHHDYMFLDAHMEKGQILYNQKKYAASLKTFQLAVTITPTFADAYYWVGKSLEALGNKADAKTNYERAFALDKSNAEAKAAAARL
ncbi:MAG: hypothetical protein JWP88_976 [Flaviaesturariibacter sp.]|nr:hypothetical protein [Flaviaesturariibacter sp.]